MADRARVSSIEAIEFFRNDLVLYLEKAALALDEVSDEVLRTRVWLESDRRGFWEHQIRLRRRELEQRQQELFSAQLCGLREAPQEQQFAVHRARRALEHAEAKWGTVKKWIRQYDGRIDPLAKEVDKLRHVLSYEMEKAVAWLTEAIDTLHAYADAGAPGPARTDAPATPNADASSASTPAPAPHPRTP